MLDLDEEAQSRIKPNEFLRERILKQITSVQTLIFGNTAKEDAVAFCNKNIVVKFATIEGDLCHTKVGSIHKGEGVLQQSVKELAEQALARTRSKNTIR